MQRSEFREIIWQNLETWSSIRCQVFFVHFGFNFGRSCWEHFHSLLSVCVFVWIWERLFLTSIAGKPGNYCLNSVWSHLRGPKWLRTLLGSISLWRWPTWKTSWGTLVWSQAVGWLFENFWDMFQSDMMSWWFDVFLCLKRHFPLQIMVAKGI